MIFKDQRTQFHRLNVIDINNNSIPISIPASTLVNGQGRWWQDPTAALSVVNVQQGKRYRLRLVSLSCDPSFTFSIDGHQLTVIEADGVETQPLNVDSLEILACESSF